MSEYGEAQRTAHVIGLGGDVSIRRTSATDPLRGVGLDETDISFVNLEGPLSDRSEAFRFERTWNPGSGHRMVPAVVGDLARVTAVSIANNHSLDYGVEGYVDTMRALDAAGIPYAGGGQAVDAARTPIVVEREGLTVALLAYTCLYGDDWPATATRPGMATVKVHTSYEPPLRVFETPGIPPIVHTFVDHDAGAQVAAEIGQARADADLVIVSMHWGISKGHREVLAYQRELGRLCIDAGAEAVFGHHAHALGPIELHRGRPICYSLGDLFFERTKPAYDDVTALIKLYVHDGRLVRLGAVPLLTDAANGGEPVRADGGAAERVARTLFPVGEHEWRNGEAVISLGVEAGVR